MVLRDGWKRILISFLVILSLICAGCSESDNELVAVSADTSLSAYCPGDTVNFQLSTSGEIDKYEWDFDGDGEFDYESSSEGETSTNYSTPGSYNATIRVTNSAGDTEEDSVVVTVDNCLPEINVVIADYNETGNPDITDQAGDPLVYLNFTDTLVPDEVADFSLITYTYTNENSSTTSGVLSFNGASVGDGDGLWELGESVVVSEAPSARVDESGNLVTFDLFYRGEAWRTVGITVQ